MPIKHNYELCVFLVVEIWFFLLEVMNGYCVIVKQMLVELALEMLTDVVDFCFRLTQ